MLLRSQSAVSAVTAAADAAMNAGPTMASGRSEPMDARRATTEPGTSEGPAVLNATSVHIGSLASLLFASSAISAMAFRPIGVAAFPRPSRFAEMFSATYSCALLLLGNPGKSSRTSGFTRPESDVERPDSSAIFIRPDQKQIAPPRPSSVCTAVAVDPRIPDVTALELPEMKPYSTPEHSRTAQTVFSKNIISRGWSAIDMIASSGVYTGNIVRNWRLENALDNLDKPHRNNAAGHNMSEARSGQAKTVIGL